MSRSGYVDDLDQNLLNLYRGTVTRVIRSKRGQKFLRELAAAMDAMPEKVLIAGELINDEGDCCTIGVVCKARGIDVSKIDYEDPTTVGNAVDIARQMAAEIEYENDECGGVYSREEGKWRSETPQERWQRMRNWVEKKIKKATVEKEIAGHEG